MPDPLSPLNDVAWDVDARLILGWRNGRVIEAAGVSLDRDVLEDLRAVGENTATKLPDRTARPYEPNAHLEEQEEYFRVPVGDLPTHARSSDTSSTASLLAATSDPDNLPRITPTNLGDYRFLFYGVVFSTTSGGTVTFIKKEDPTRAAASVKLSMIGGSRLRRAEPPVLMLKEDIDLIVTGTDVIVLRKSAFEHLFNDVQVALQDVSLNVAAAEGRLSSTIPLRPGARDALKSAASKRISYAVRLRGLTERINQINPTPQMVRDQLASIGAPANTLLDGDEFDFDGKHVGLFLDLMEGRHFPDGWTGERMRADRMSHYRPGP